MNINIDYIAGFIDGEGYIGLIKKSSKVCTLGYYYTPVLKITQVTQNDFVLKEIKKFMGYGNFSFDKRSVNPKQRNKSCLEIRGAKRVIPVIKKLFPHLIVKSKQAKLILDYEKLLKSTNGMNEEHKKLRLEVDKKRTELYKKILFLNKRGLAETE